MNDLLHPEDDLQIDFSQLEELLGKEETDMDLDALLRDYTSTDEEASTTDDTAAPQEVCKYRSRKHAGHPRKSFSLPKKRGALFVCIGMLTLLLLLGAGMLIGRALDPYDSRMLPNTTIGGIPVGEMTRWEAYKVLKNATKDTFSQNSMVVTLPDGTISLSPEDTKAKLKTWSAVKDAYRQGRKGTPEEKQAALAASEADGLNVDMLPHLRLEQDFIRRQLEDYAARHNVPHTEYRYQLSGQQPKLEEDLYDANAPMQVLELTLGTPLEELDVEAVMAEILNAYSFNTFAVSIDSIAHQTTPQAPDLDKLYQEFYIPPVDTTLDMNTYQQIPGSYGYALDLEAGKKLLGNASYGETIEIPMAYVKPDILGDEAYFRDELGYCETPHGNNANRNTNLQLACASLNGLILQPGEEFSYNAALGERTKERGYKPAPAYSGTNLVDSIGGGICQVSSTLYCATLYADMEIIFRVNHGFRSNYIGLGLDATVSWGKPDFQFRNNSNFPIMIQAEDSDDHVKIRIMGTEERDYYIKMTSGYSEDDDNIYCWTYKNKYDRETDELISKEKEAYSRYSK